MIHRDIDRTAGELDRRDAATAPVARTLRAMADDQRRRCWRRCSRRSRRCGSGAVAPELGTAEALRLAHLMLLPAGVMAERLFDGEAARLLLLGNAMHADVPIDAPGSGVMGYLLIMMAQDGGLPVPVGGAAS